MKYTKELKKKGLQQKREAQLTNGTIDSPKDRQTPDNVDSTQKQLNDKIYDNNYDDKWREKAFMKGSITIQ